MAYRAYICTNEDYLEFYDDSILHSVEDCKAWVTENAEEIVTECYYTVWFIDHDNLKLFSIDITKQYSLSVNTVN